MNAQYKTPSPKEIRREFLETLRFKVRDAVLALDGVDRALTELTIQEGFGGDLRPETQAWAEGGIHALIEGRLPRRLDLEVAG